MQKAMENMKRWMNEENLDETLKQELINLKDENDIYERFYKELEFGTGGLRGILGAGTNRMNIYTVRKATQGFADYINQHYKEGCKCYKGLAPSVAISYDSRINSELFARETAMVFAANGIKSYIYSELMPTPVLSFAVRHFKCCAGVMVTASHNPAKYNGYKVYNDEGCQLTLDAAAEVLALIEKIHIFDDVKTTSNPDKLIEIIPEQVFEKYLEAVKKESTGAIGCGDLSVVFTPLNGTGNKPVRRILEMIGVSDVKIVEAQELPDGNFPTCPYPNPEKKEALALGLELCKNLEAKGTPPDILMATDPDCDRIGIAVRHSGENKTPEYILVTGNEVGILLLDFICTRRIEANKDGGDHLAKPMPENPIAIKTIVTSKMADQVAKNYNVAMVDVLTGFKFIGEQIGFLEAKGEEDRYIFGFEESYGYLAGSYVRDKDAVNGAMLICEMAAYYKTQGKTLIDRMQELYEKYGYYENDLIEFAFEGASGMETMERIMKSMRIDMPSKLANEKIVEIADYELSQRRYIGNCSSCSLVAGMRPIKLPKSDVMEYVLSDGSSVIARPSGTEPKLKIYISAKGSSSEKSNEMVNIIKSEITEIIEQFQ